MPVRTIVGTPYNFDAASDSRSVTVPADCEVLQISCSTTSSGLDQSGVTVGGQAMTKVTTVPHAGGKPRITVWRLIAPPTGSQTVVVTLSGGSDKTGVVVSSWTDIDGAAPFDSPVSATGTSTTPSVVISSETGDLVADSAASLSIGSNTPGANQTEQWDQVPVDGRIFGSVENGAASVTMSWTNDLAESKEWVIIAVNANAPAGGAASSLIWQPAPSSIYLR